MKINKSKLQNYKFLLSIFLLILFISLRYQGVAQSRQNQSQTAQPSLSLLTGTITDEETGEPLGNAIVQIRGSRLHTTTDVNGYFRFVVPAGFYELEIIHPSLYRKYYNVTSFKDLHTPIGAIRLTPRIHDGPLQYRISNFSSFRYSGELNYNRYQTQIISSQQRFTDHFQNSASIYIQENGGSFAQSTLNIRGLSGNQVAGLFENININNPENRQLNSPLLQAMQDWTDRQALQINSDPEHANQQSYAGVLNMPSLMPEKHFNIKANLVYGSNGFYKTGLTINSGKSKNDLSGILKFTRSVSDGLIQQTHQESIGLFLKMVKDFSPKRRLMFTAAIQTWQADLHLFTDSIGIYTSEGTDYNNSWGYLNEKALNWNQSFGNNPLFILSYDRQIRQHSFLINQLYLRLNRSVITRPVGRIHQYTTETLPKTTDYLLPIDEIYNWNQGTGDSTLWGTNRMPNDSGLYYNSKNKGISILGNTTRSTEIGLQNQLIHDFSPSTNIRLRWNLSWYQADHFDIVSNLLGADGYQYSDSLISSDQLASEFFPKLKSAISVGNYYKNKIGKTDFSIALKHKWEKLSFQGSGSWHLRYFNRTNEDTGEQSEKIKRSGYSFTGQFLLPVTNHQRLIWKNSVVKTAPSFSQLFPFRSITIFNHSESEQFYHSELNYQIAYRRISLATNGYFIYLKDHLNYHDYNTPGNDSPYFIAADEFHYGGEINGRINYAQHLNLLLSGSYTHFRYSSNGIQYSRSPENDLFEKEKLGLKKYRVPNLPEIKLSLTNEWNLAKGAYFKITYSRFWQRYAPLSSDNFSSENKPRQIQIPSFDLLNSSLNYYWESSRKDRSVLFSFSANNILDEQYINLMTTNYILPELINKNQVFYGLGRRWQARLTFSF